MEAAKAEEMKKKQKFYTNIKINSKLQQQQQQQQHQTKQHNNDEEKS